MIEYSAKPNLVDAIEEGRIVKVPEDYARREGLLILRKNSSVLGSQAQTPAGKKDEETRKNKGFIGMDDLRKPLSVRNNELMNELVENFHWTLVQKRKARGLTRKKLADSLGESEVNVKMIENGVLPLNNFVLINKLESYYGITLRKNKVASVPTNRPLRQVIDFAGRIAARRDASKMPSFGAHTSMGREGSSKQDSAEIEIIDVDSGEKGGDAGAKESSADDSDMDIVKL